MALDWKTRLLGVGLDILEAAGTRVVNELRAGGARPGAARHIPGPWPGTGLRPGECPGVHEGQRCTLAQGHAGMHETPAGRQWREWS